jgi:pyruvate/2-oxoglutarate dehydrogenase complex dihydrolipoamide acyltransferase (E2) component
MSSSRTEMLIDVLMPAMGTSITEGTVIEWRKLVGDQVEADETICEISTDKVDTECPAPVDGTVTEIIVTVGETVEVGTVLARIATTSDSAETSGNAPQAPVMAPERTPQTPTKGANGALVARGGAGTRYSPVVARMLAAHELDPAAILGTGRNGRITKKDVLAALEQPASVPDEPRLHSDSPYRPDPATQPAPAGARQAEAQPLAHTPAGDLGGVPTELSRIRQMIGARMRDSQHTAATCHTIVECDMTALEQQRRELGLTALPLVASAAVDTLREFPDLNATLEATTITRFERVHLGIAVSLGPDGLIVPVVHDAQDLSPQGLGARIRDLAARARSRDLLPDEVQGATFTITSPGAYGAIVATPVINLPQVGILDLEAIVRRPVVITTDGQESIAIRSVVNLILGWDHRAIDGVYAAQFLSALRNRLQQATP